MTKWVSWLSGLCFPRVRRIITCVKPTWRCEEYLDNISHGVVVETGYPQIKTKCGTVMRKMVWSPKSGWQLEKSNMLVMLVKISSVLIRTGCSPRLGWTNIKVLVLNPLFPFSLYYVICYHIYYICIRTFWASEWHITKCIHKKVFITSLTDL